MAKLINNTGLIADEELTQISLADWQSNSDALMGQKLELVLKSDETVDLINEGAAQVPGFFTTAASSVQTLTEQRALIVGIVLIADTEGGERSNSVIQILIITQRE